MRLRKLEQTTHNTNHGHEGADSLAPDVEQHGKPTRLTRFGASIKNLYDRHQDWLDEPTDPEMRRQKEYEDRLRDHGYKRKTNIDPEGIVPPTSRWMKGLDKDE